MSPMRTAADRVFVVCFALFLAGICLFTLQNRSETISASENRTLEPKPALTRESLVSGDYFAAWDSFWADRAAGRATILKNHTLSDWKVLHKPVVNDIVITDDHLLPFYSHDSFTHKEPPEQAVQPIVTELAALDQHIASCGGKFFYVGIPGQLSYFHDLYPNYLENGQNYFPHLHQVFAQALSDSGISYINMYERFSSLGNPSHFYYKTDHHYSFDGAFYTYQCLMEQITKEISLPVLTKDTITCTTLPNPFSGSRNRQLYQQFPTEEHIVYGVPKEPIPFTRQDDGKPVAPTMLDLPSPNELVTYGLYMGGDKGETIIETHRPELPKLLIFGASFTNALETLLYASFDEMHSLDLRHYTGMSLYAYIQNYQPDVVVCVTDETGFLNPIHPEVPSHGTP